MATTAIVVVVALMLLALGFTYTYRLARIESQASSLQTAADAAALAGAQSIISELPTELPMAMMNETTLPGGLGQDAAGLFAGRNNAELVSYQYQPETDSIALRVRSVSHLETGRYEDAIATARVGLRLTTCVLPEIPPPPPDSSEDPDAPATVSGTATCGELSVPVTITVATGAVTLDISDDELKARFTAALKA
ncbi:MAG: pilus assembly protein TadG-related protein [Propioniciclava sp.]